MIIVCYTGGTCGDLVSAMYDMDGVSLNTNSRTVVHKSYRIALKKPHLFNNDWDKDQYLDQVKMLCRSVPSHDTSYHVQRGHEFVTTAIDKKSTAIWAAKRFRQCHRPHVWQEMQDRCGAKTIDDYAEILLNFSRMIQQHTDKIIWVEDIVQGQLIQSLHKMNWNVSQEAMDFYYEWLSLQ